MSSQMGSISATAFLGKTFISFNIKCSRKKVMKIEYNQGRILTPYSEYDVCKLTDIVHPGLFRSIREFFTHSTSPTEV